MRQAELNELARIQGAINLADWRRRPLSADSMGGKAM